MIPLVLALLTQDSQREPMPQVPRPSHSATPVVPSMSWRSTAPALETRTRIAADLSRAVESVRESGEARGESLAELRAAAVLAATALGPGSQNSARITRAVTAADEAVLLERPKAALSSLMQELERLSRDLSFTPLVESPRPVGFPPPTVVGEFEVLAYPAYRMARTPMPRSLLGQRNSAFWKLFRHIQSHDIPMTAPVEMTWGPRDGTRSEAGRDFDSMAFLYVSTGVGREGPDGDVEVLDVAAATVASVGVRGSSSDRRVREERERLEAWIAGQPERFEILGPPRMMGWNSPMVEDARRYWEVQFPVRVLEPAASGTD